ncbi:MAG: hypothetical protein K0Q64_1709 [Nitrobacter vulgaris]|jgi:hypothetical protein|nr:hypothetical protein [Nitrobacter vulgaris]
MISKSGNRFSDKIMPMERIEQSSIQRRLSDTDQRLTRANEMVIMVLNEYQSAVHSGLNSRSQNQPSWPASHVSWSCAGAADRPDKTGLDRCDSQGLAENATGAL